MGRLDSFLCIDGSFSSSSSKAGAKPKLPMARLGDLYFSLHFWRLAVDAGFESKADL